MFLICAEFTDGCSSLSKEPLTMEFMGQWRHGVMAPALAAGASPPGIPYYRTHRALTHFSLGLQIEPSTFAKCLWLFFTPTIKKPLKLNLGIKFRVSGLFDPTRQGTDKHLFVHETERSEGLGSVWRGFNHVHDLRVGRGCLCARNQW